MKKKTFSSLIKHVKKQYKEAMDMIESQTDYENEHYNYEIIKAFYCGKASAYKEMECSFKNHLKG